MTCEYPRLILPTQSAIGEALEPMRVSHIIAPSRAEEFESFKRGKGAELNRILTENKSMSGEGVKSDGQRHGVSTDINFDHIGQPTSERRSYKQSCCRPL